MNNYRANGRRQHPEAQREPAACAAITPDVAEGDEPDRGRRCPSAVHRPSDSSERHAGRDAVKTIKQTGARSQKTPRGRPPRHARRLCFLLPCPPVGSRGKTRVFLGSAVLSQPCPATWTSLQVPPRDRSKVRPFPSVSTGTSSPPPPLVQSTVTCPLCFGDSSHWVRLLQLCSSSAYRPHDGAAAYSPRASGVTPGS